MKIDNILINKYLILRFKLNILHCLINNYNLYIKLILLSKKKFI